MLGAVRGAARILCWASSLPCFHLKLPRNDGKFERRNLSPDSGIVNVTNACLSEYFCLSWEGEGQILIATVHVAKLS